MTSLDDLLTRGGVRVRWTGPAGEPVVTVTLDRPETRNALDMYHFRDLAGAWKRFRDDDDAWVAIVTGVGDAFMAGADLKTYIPQITELHTKIAGGEVTEIDGALDTPARR